jgi:hypothetical protein
METALHSAIPTVLFPFRPDAARTGPSYAVTRNGQRFLLSAIVEADAKAALSVVQNWTEGIKPCAANKLRLARCGCATKACGRAEINLHSYATSLRTCRARTSLIRV